MKSKLLTLNFQRNGVGGESFYSATIQNIYDYKGIFLITFNVLPIDEDKVNSTTCRCVMLEGKDNPFYENWRGDEIGHDLNTLLQNLIKKHNVESLWDLHALYENKATKQNIPFSYKKETNEA
jgi:hypothetical protein